MSDVLVRKVTLETKTFTQTRAVNKVLLIEVGGDPVDPTDPTDPPDSYEVFGNVIPPIVFLD